MQIFNPYKTFKGSFIPNAILQCKDISQSAKLMWGRLAQYAGENGRCFPKIKTLGAEIGLSHSGARKSIRELRDYGLIVVKEPGPIEKSKHWSSEYFFVYHEIFNLPPVDKNSEGPKTDGREGPKTDGREGPKTDGPIKENHTRDSIINLVPDGCTPGDDSEKPKKYHGTDEDHALAKQIYEAVLVVNSTIKEPNWDRWANEIRLMREQDGRTHDDIWRVFLFANRDQFWCHNVLSPAALRRHYARLAPKAGMVRSQVRGATADVTEQKPGRTCGMCAFAGKGRKICGGVDGIADHPACDLFRDGGKS